MSILSGEKNCLFKAACALAFGLSFALTACDDGDKAMAQLDDSSAETPSPAINEDESSPSEESASEDDSLPTADNKDMFQENGFKECNAENEGIVDSIVVPDGPVELKHYYKCEQGSWVNDDVGFTCGTTDVQVGQPCLYTIYYRRGSIATAYIYTSDGIWEPAEDILGECNNEYKDYSWVVGSDTIVRSYQCIYGYWFDGDTCSYESDDGKSENGSWTSETKDDIEKDSRFEDFECSEENEGREVEVLPTSEDAYPPGEIYKCTSGKLVFVDYNYSRSQKSGL